MCSPASLAGSSIDGVSNLNTSNNPLSPSSAMLSPTALADASSSSCVNKKTIFTAKGKGKKKHLFTSNQQLLRRNNHWFGRNELNYVHYQDFNTFQEE